MKRRLWMMCAWWLLSQRHKRRRLIPSPYLTAPELPLPPQSPWATLKCSGRDEAFLVTIGFGKEAFRHLVNITAPYLHRSHRSHFKMDVDDVVGLILMWLTTQVRQKHLQLVFGQTPAVICRELKRGRNALLHAVTRDPKCVVRWPTVS